jgi:hypothetical protein
VPSDGAVARPEAGSAPGTYNGVIEGFYGPPWSHDDRLSMIRWLARHKPLSTYVYAPKDDPYLRQAWRDPYPAAEAARLRELADLARSVGVRFVYQISPGLDMCYSAPDDRAALVQKLGQVRTLGVRAFMLALDDIPRSFHCSADETTYGVGDAAIGGAHAAVANLIAQWNPSGSLLVVPMDYSELVRTPYLGALAHRLAATIDLVWTGPYVVPSRISAAQADAIARVYGRRPVLWDNYPVNDFARDDLHLGPVAGRAPTLPRHLAGLIANPMNEAEASKIPLATLSAYLRDPLKYRPDAAWRAAVRELGGRRGAPVLQRLADNSQSSSTLDDPRPVWARESSVLWPRALRLARALRGGRWEGPLVNADRRLRVEWRTLIELPRVLPAPLAAELDPWTKALATNDDLGRAALAYVAATRPRFRAVRSHRQGAGWATSGRLLSPDRAELGRLAGAVDTTAAAVRRLTAETHGGSTLFLHGLAMARRSCTPTAVRVTLDGRPLRIGAGGSFNARTAARPRRLLARDRRGFSSVQDFSSPSPEITAASPTERRARRQVEARLQALSRAVLREDLGALRRYDVRPGGFDAWRGLLAVSRFFSARFTLGAFDAGALSCGGPVVAEVNWQLAGKVPPGVTYGKGGNGTLGRPTVVLLSNRGTARAPDWRIVYALRFLPYPNAVNE